jgi:hypothetical protein
MKFNNQQLTACKLNPPGMRLHAQRYVTFLNPAEMKKILFLIIPFLSLTLSGQSHFDNSKIAILPFNNSSQSWIFKDRKQAEIVDTDFEKIEKILKECIEDYNPKQEKRFNEINLDHPEYKLRKDNFIIVLENYKRQYIVVTNPKGEKEVWINCFCQTTNGNWKKELVLVKDGGNCFFNVIINLTTGKYHTLLINGDA